MCNAQHEHLGWHRVVTSKTIYLVFTTSCLTLLLILKIAQKVQEIHKLQIAKLAQISDSVS